MELAPWILPARAEDLNFRKFVYTSKDLSQDLAFEKFHGLSDYIQSIPSVIVETEARIDTTCLVINPPPMVETPLAHYHIFAIGE